VKRRHLHTDAVVAPAAFVLVVVAVVAVSWPFESTSPTFGIDPSWQAALNMASHHGLDWGRDVVWTSGPLGYLKAPLIYYGPTFEAAMLYSLAIRLAAAAVLIVAIGRTMPLTIAAVIACLTLSVLTEDPALVLAVATALLLLERPPEARHALLLAALLGGWAGLEALGKLSIGAVVAIVLAIGVGAQRKDRWRRLGAFAGGFVVVLLALWLASGQSVSALPSYLRNSLAIVGGYSDAMGVDQPGPAWHYWAAATIAVIALVGAARGAATTRTAAIAIVAVFLFAEFKEAFVRHDNAHVLYFFTAALCLVPALGWGRARWAAGAVATLLVALAVVVVMRDAHVDPSRGLSALPGQLAQMLDPGARASDAARVRAELGDFYGLDPRLRRLLAGHPTDVLPYEQSAAWAYNLAWRPLPVFQDYQAYSSRLDRINAARLAGGDGPRRILRRLETTVDGRFSSFDPPAQYIGLLCNFRQLVSTRKWQVLAKVPDRCGAQRRVGGTHSVGWGQPVRVPAAPAGTALVAYVEGVGIKGFERLRAFLLRPHNRYVVMDGRRYRIAPAVARDGLLVWTPPGTDYGRRFAVSPQAHSLAFLIGTGKQPSGRPLRVTFKAMPIR
jgi:hypothetical protein